MTVVKLSDLGEPRTLREFQEKLPSLWAHGLANGVYTGQEDLDEPLPQRVFGTRVLGRVLASKLPPDAVLDLEGVEVLTTAVIDELLKVNPGLTYINANEDVIDSWAIVVEHREERGA